MSEFCVAIETRSYCSPYFSYERKSLEFSRKNCFLLEPCKIVVPMREGLRHLVSKESE